MVDANSLFFIYYCNLACFSAKFTVKCPLNRSFTYYMDFCRFYLKKHFIALNIAICQNC